MPELACRPNLDGRIDANELMPVVGSQASYVLSPAGVRRPVDVTGTVDQSGRRIWDWSIDFADDQVARLAAAPLAGRWYASSFPQGELVSPLDSGGVLEAVYAHDEQALWLLGFASFSDQPQSRTLAVYTRPVPVWRFPLQVGASWNAVGEVRDGLFRGLPYAARDTYQISIDAAGHLVLPDLTFTQALRARTKVTIEPSVGAPTTQRTVSFVFECFGEVARAVAAPDDSKEDFTTAAEVRRLGL